VTRKGCGAWGKLRLKTAQKMNPPILVLSNALAGGGAEIVARLMIASIENATGVVFENDARINISGRVVEATGHKHSGGIWYTLWANLVRLTRIQRAKFRLKPACTISHLEGPNFANLLTISGGPRLLFVHNKISESYERKTLRDRAKYALCRFLYPRADCIVAVSQGIADELVKAFRIAPSKISVQNNPVDIGSIRTAAGESCSGFVEMLDGQRYIVSVASLTEQKNHLQMLQVFKELASTDDPMDQLKLALLGDGPLRKELEEFSRGLGLTTWSSAGRQIVTRDTQVFFLGYQKNPYPLISTAQALIMTSFWEGLPISLLEAMSLGVPAVVSDSSTGIRDLWRVSTSDAEKLVNLGRPVDTPFGVLMPSTRNREIDLSAWVDSLHKVISMGEGRERYQEKCQARAADYDLAKAVPAWDSLLQQHLS